MTQTYPAPITAAMLAVANQNADKPRYSAAGSADWAGGAIGDDVAVSTANVALARSGGGANEADYTPRTQAAKATALATTIVVDVGRSRGWLEPDDPYAAAPGAGQNPTITSLAPNTAVAVTGADLVVVITGTNFTPWSTVTSGNYPIPVRYVSPTKLEIVQKPRSSVAGTVQVVVTDHGVASAPSNFVFT
jgi:hypothetical protein